METKRSRAWALTGERSGFRQISPPTAWTVAVELSLPDPGHFGAVYLARVKRADGFLLALKCLQKKDIEQNGSETQVRREIEVRNLWQLGCQNLGQLLIESRS